MKTTSFIAALLLFLCFSWTVAAQDEATAVAVLQKLDLEKATDAELFDAVAACRRLTVAGTEQSVDTLEKLLGDPRMASYARTALRNIGGDKADAALKKHPPEADNASPVSEKLLAAEKQVAMIVAGGAEALDLFAKLLKSDDKFEFHAALEAFRRYPGREIVDRLAKEQASLKPERRVGAIDSMLDRKDVAPIPSEIVEAVKSGPNPDVRAAAVTVLGAFSDEKNLDVLFGLLDGPVDDTVSEALVEALATTKTPNLNEKVLALLDDDNPEKRAFGILLVRERHVTEARDRLWELQKQTSGINRLLMLGTFGRVGGREGFVRLLDLYSKDPSSASVFAGLSEACKLAADRTAYVKLVAEKLPQEKDRLALYGELGGPEALKSIAEIAKTTAQDDIRDQATKILGEWTGAEVAPVLLDLSASLSEEKYKVRTLRGFLRAVRQFDMPKEEKRKLCEKALGVATRDEEKKLIRDVMAKL